MRGKARRRRAPIVDEFNTVGNHPDFLPSVRQSLRTAPSWFRFDFKFSGTAGVPAYLTSADVAKALPLSGVDRSYWHLHRMRVWHAVNISEIGWYVCAAPAGIDDSLVALPNIAAIPMDFYTGSGTQGAAPSCIDVKFNRYWQETALSASPLKGTAGYNILIAEGITPTDRGTAYIVDVLVSQSHTRSTASLRVVAGDGVPLPPRSFCSAAGTSVGWGSVEDLAVSSLPGP